MEDINNKNIFIIIDQIFFWLYPRSRDIWVDFFVQSFLGQGWFSQEVNIALSCTWFPTIPGSRVLSHVLKLTINPLHRASCGPKCVTQHTILQLFISPTVQNVFCLEQVDTELCRFYTFVCLWYSSKIVFQLEIEYQPLWL